jgi:hypothetical protein
MVFSKEDANKLLSFGIRLLQGKVCKSPRNEHIRLALILKERLEDYGFLWQARTLNYWIHRFQGGQL